ncbi:Long-chain-fatty-acid--CoA ligase [Pseudonocardia sp. Ae263_Ps1]|nr:Long-chain-fatty-acid--CoA ligase [Pseudonocardia sp. Ae150A_Ps1]OLL83836.1 Long-chain-fatty-acid--CoA ligase [Pseudonocardia sp. Ae263_Ps1]
MRLVTIPSDTNHLEEPPMPTGAHTDVEELLDALETGRDREALVHGDRRLTAGHVADTVHRLAHTLDGRVGPGQVVALLAGNSPEALIARYAVNLLGAGVTQPHEGLAAAAQARIVDDVEPALVLVDAAQAEQAAAVLDHAAPAEVLALGTVAGREDVLAESAAASTEPVRGRARPEDVEQIRHTGGTTGHPKGITYTFDHHTRAARLREAMEPLTPQGPARMLVATPVAHAGGGVADRMLTGGGTVVLLDRFDAGDFLAAVERERITHSFLLPPLLYRLLDHPGLDETDLSSLRSLLYGGAPANPRRIAEAHERIGPVLTQFYGQTEAGGISILTPAEHEKPELLGTVGRIVPSTEIAITGDDGARVADGEHGELWVHTGTEMDGYWKQPELTARTISDGWVRTGDVARLDDAGYLHLVDRVKDMVIVVGGHVYTSELEDTLMEHPGVRQAAVFGVPDGDGTEVVHAAVVAGDPAPSAGDLTGLVAERAGDMYVPLVSFVPELPLTGIGKTDKKRLRAELTGVTA